MASTLSLGQGSFVLGLDSGSGTDPTQIAVNSFGGSGTSPTGFFVSSTTGAPIENLGGGLEANLGKDADTVTISGSVFGSTIDLDASQTDPLGGADRFVAQGGFFNSTVNSGAGNDTLIFSKEVIGSTINTGDGNDQVIVGAGSTVEDSSFDLGAGNDTISFEGLVFGSGGDDLIALGIGSDTLVFGASSYVEGYTIDLGSDLDIDGVFFNSGLTAFQDITITGAGLGDTLFIGAGGDPSIAGSYTFDGTFFSNADDTLTFLS